MKAYFLGAGASIDFGGPMTGDILPLAFGPDRVEGEEVADDLLALAREFIGDYFRVSWDDGTGRIELETILPQLGDILTALDQLLLDNEWFGSKYPPKQLGDVRRAFHYAIYRGLRTAMTKPELKARRETLLAGFTELIERDMATATPSPGGGLRVIVVTPNYDTLTNTVLAKWLNRGVVDLGTTFENYPPRPEMGRLPGPEIGLYKLHGSLDWLYCPSCDSLTLGEKLKTRTTRYDKRFSYVAGSRTVKGDPGRIPMCNRHPVVLQPVLITPTLLKTYANPHITAVYRSAWEELCHSESVTFIGYSLPPEDHHLINLLKRTLVRERRDGTFEQAAIEVVGELCESESIANSEVEKRYRRIFGDVRFHATGFAGYLDRKPTDS